MNCLDPLSPAIRHEISLTIEEFLATQESRLASIGAEPTQLLELAHQATSGGKRLRPAACLAGWLCVAEAPGDAERAALMRAAASLDILHVSALVHDDVMDGSDTRRGDPTVHRALEADHRARAGRGKSETFGQAGAILLGDLLVMWSAEMFENSGLVGIPIARPYLEAMRTEVTVGQFLDITAASKDPRDPAALADADRVVEFKTARYTVLRPTQIGAALAGASPAVLDTLARFGSPLGRAFQFRDDLLGVFGDQAKTGKPAGDDLREGKRTVLVAHAFTTLDESSAARLDALLGCQDLDAAGVDEARELIRQSGAAERVEQMIAELRAEALTTLEDEAIQPAGRAALTDLVSAALDREH